MSLSQHTEPLPISSETEDGGGSTVSIVVAAAANNAIGKNNQLLWHLPNDMKFFKNTTWALPVIMGRKTFESLAKPLMGRTNIVITSQNNWTADGVLAAGNLEQALKLAATLQTQEVMVIGGGQVYAAALPLAQRIYLTRVHTEIEGDTFFPEINANEWRLTDSKDFEKDDKHVFDYSFQIWERF